MSESRCGGQNGRPTTFGDAKHGCEIRAVRMRNAKCEMRNAAVGEALEDGRVRRGRQDAKMQSPRGPLLKKGNSETR